MQCCGLNPGPPVWQVGETRALLYNKFKRLGKVKQFLTDGSAEQGTSIGKRLK